MKTMKAKAVYGATAPQKRKEENKMKGKYEKRAAYLIEINWINISQIEAASGAADRITEMLLEAGYKPNGRDCAPELQDAYTTGQKVDGTYVRLPQETWDK